MNWPVTLAELPMLDISNVTATAVLGWYAWHTATRTIPQIVKLFREDIAAMRAESRAERQMLYEELAAERHLRHADQIAMVDALHELTERVAATHATNAN
jgi:hypothetical protein